MQLSKLEIKGFKSFGEKITIHFDRGVTGIVGPNGCGKSNVVDAIRWVLGEQKSRNLRSDKMENLIFNGTRSRKPLQMAEVSLTFLNTKGILPTEYTTVSVTRRYYRDGDGEYLLNGVTCRLKDITSLFLDTGIGPDSYSIIELKMVDDILSDRENSRRALLEEAAGVSKFKIRKKETLRKLEDTEADLVRLEDVLFEIRKNLKALEKQARQAEEYYSIKDAYKTAAIQHARFSLSAKADVLLALKSKVSDSQDIRSGLSAKMATLEAEIEDVKAKLAVEEKTLNSRQKTLNEYVTKIRDLESQKKIREDRQGFYEERTLKLTREIQDLKKQKEGIEAHVAQTIAYQKSEQVRLEELKVDLAWAQEQLLFSREDSETLRAQLDLAQTQLRDHQQRFYELQKTTEVSETQKIDLENELKRAEVATEDQTVFLGNFEKKLEAISLDLEKKCAQILEAEKKEQELGEQVNLKGQEAEVLRQNLADFFRKLDARQNELNLTRAMVENMEGFPEAVKYLRKNKSWSRKAPLVTDLINIGEKYKIALESVLEPFLNYYVVQTEMEAYLGMKLLSENQKGKANFFVLDRFANLEPRPTIEISEAIPAVNLVEFDPQYARLVSHLLDGVYITDKTIPFASSSAETPVLFGDLSWNWTGYTIVSISGAMTQRPYSISGGSISVFEGNKIGKAVHLKNLENQIAELNLLIHNEKIAEEQNHEQIARLREATQKSLIHHLQTEVNQLRQEQAALAARKEQSLELLKSSTERKENMISKIAQLEIQVAASKPELDLIGATILQLEKQLQDGQARFKGKSEETQMVSGKFNQINIQVIQLQNALNAKVQEIEFRQGELLKIEERQQLAENEFEKVQEELSKLLASEENSNQELPALYAERKAIEEGMNEAERTYFQARGMIDQKEKEVRELGRRREQTSVLIAECQEAMNEARLQLISIQERVHVEFETVLDLEAELPSPNASEEEAWRIKAQNIKNQLDRIGPINLMAREAYQEIKERNDFIETQKRDLLEARDSLKSTISEIESVAKDTFLATFHKVQENFKMVFRSLFTSEDTCDLILSNPELPLDSPIDIMARPKGKRPLTINQLSGGEKTLTAISLLFAIYLIKPAPFCIFDEADAPLDDSNIDKFNNIIRKFSADSQFIIVTHNKRTMASTDVIYGVTMPEQGVSRVIPVDLRELA